MRTRISHGWVVGYCDGNHRLDRGHEVVFEGDNILFAGDVVMNRRFLAFASPYSNVNAWLASLDALEKLHPRTIVPSHGDVGDASLIPTDRAVLTTVQARVAELKKQGKSADEAADALRVQLQMTHPDWVGPQNVTAAAKAAYAEAR